MFGLSLTQESVNIQESHENMDMEVDDVFLNTLSNHCDVVTEINARDKLAPTYNNLVNALDTLNDNDLIESIKEEMQSHISKIRKRLEQSSSVRDGDTVGVIDDKNKKKGRVFNTHHM